MSDNYITVDLRCTEIISRPIMTLMIDLDKVSDTNGVVIDMSREDLAQLGEMATWYQT